jgi:hypothetical protein
MDRDEILKKIAEIKQGLSLDQYQIVLEKIAERKLQLHRSKRNIFSKRIIEKMRKKLIQELELILEPMLENQKEINLRFLEEIERLKKACLSSGIHGPDESNKTKTKEPPTKG